MNDETNLPARIAALEARVQGLVELLGTVAQGVQTLHGRLEIAARAIEVLQDAEIKRHSGRHRPQLN
jgi:hypothetical protein